MFTIIFNIRYHTFGGFIILFPFTFLHQTKIRRYPPKKKILQIIAQDFSILPMVRTIVLKNVSHIALGGIANPLLLSPLTPPLKIREDIIIIKTHH